VAQDEDAIKLLAFGSHENFYLDLKREKRGAGFLEMSCSAA